jgi:hypothetical protein
MVDAEGNKVDLSEDLLRLENEMNNYIEELNLL